MIESRREGPERPNDPLAASLAGARAGNDSDLGRVFEAARRYLLLVANRSLDSQLHPKVAPSDLVQETFLDAHRNFKRFAGDSKTELFAWLRQILLHKAADAGRRYRGTAKRNINEEQPLDGRSSVSELSLEAQEPSPSGVAICSENERQLDEAMARLPADYRQVLELRSLERLAFAEVGRRMGRSEDAVGKLWFRALQKLRDELACGDESANAYSR